MSWLRTQVSDGRWSLFFGLGLACWVWGSPAHAARTDTARLPPAEQLSPTSFDDRQSSSSSFDDRQFSSSERWFRLSFLLDWGIALGIGVGGYLVFRALPPVERDWSAGDSSLSLPHRSPLLTRPWPLVLATGIPLAGFAVAQLWLRSGHDLHHAALGLTEALALTIAISGALQVAVGRLRPDWRDRCRPTIETLSCTGPDDVVVEGRRSFPAQNVAFVFTGATYLSLYLADKLNVFQGDGALWKVALVLAPLTGATLLGISEIVQHQHHWEDVLVGGLLGVVSASLCYHLLFERGAKVGRPIRRGRVSLFPVSLPGGAGVGMLGRW